MIARLQTRAQRLRMTVDARVMDGQALEFPNESFDAAILHLIVAVVPDPVKCLTARGKSRFPQDRPSVFQGNPRGLTGQSNFCHGLLSEVARVLRPGGRAVIFDKFVPDIPQPPLVLRLLNPLTSLFGTEITRRLGPLLAGTGLHIVHEEPAGVGGLLKIALVRKAGR